jgi:hypothetical protein
MDLYKLGWSRERKVRRNVLFQVGDLPGKEAELKLASDKPRFA